MVHSWVGKVLLGFAAVGFNVTASAAEGWGHDEIARAGVVHTVAFGDTSLEVSFQPLGSPSVNEFTRVRDRVLAILEDLASKELIPWRDKLTVRIIEQRANYSTPELVSLGSVVNLIARASDTPQALEAVLVGFVHALIKVTPGATRQHTFASARAMAVDSLLAARERFERIFRSFETARIPLRVPPQWSLRVHPSKIIGRDGTDAGLFYQHTDLIDVISLQATDAQIEGFLMRYVPKPKPKR